MNENNSNKEEPITITAFLCDFFLPSYEDVLETLPGGEEIVVKHLYVPIGFLAFLGLMVTWGVVYASA